MNATSLTGTHPERGFSLFEVLITVVVISIGLLGLAGLQFAGLRAANSAHEHTYANLLAQDIEERIRANQAVNYGSFDLTTDGSAPRANNCVTSNCSAAQLYDFDRRRWYYTINSGGDDGLDNTPVLPNATIKVRNVGATTYTITIEWGDPSGRRTLNAQFSL